MDFTHYSSEAVDVAVDLVNSRGSITGNEYLGDREALVRFLEAHGVKESTNVTGRDVAEVHALREDLRAVFEARDEEEAVGRLNKLLAEAGTVPEITNHGGEAWHLHYAPRGAPIAQRLAAMAAMGLAIVLCEFGWERLGICAADPCRDVFVDTSRNRSRRYCNDTCSSRINVAAYRARRSSD